MFRTDNFSKVATIPVGKLPHGIWPSGDGSRVYVGLENDDRMIAIDTLTNRVIATVPIGQAPQAVIYVPDAVPEGMGTQGLEPLGVAGNAAHFTMSPPGGKAAESAQAPTSVTLFDQGLVSTGRLPPAELVRTLVAEAHGRYKCTAEGTNSQAYPGLAEVASDLFGVCVVGTGGDVYPVGGAEYEFSIMSVSKPFVFALFVSPWVRSRHVRNLG